MKTLTFILSLVIASIALAEEPATADKGPDIDDPKILAEILEGAADKTKIHQRGKKGEELRYLVNTEIPFTGWSKSMHGNGQVECLACYENGKKHGLDTEWYENGQKGWEHNYKNNMLEGKTTSWYENGQKKIEATYVDGNQHGLFTTWYENGQKNIEANYQDDNTHGLITYWYENGQKKSEMNHKNGQNHGQQITWHENGQKKLEANYQEGKRSGASTFWNENGEVREKKEYKNGVLISKNGVPLENLDTGKWVLSEDSDPVTDKKIIMAVLDAEENVNITLDVRPKLVIRKKGSSFDAYVIVGTSVSPQNVLSDYMPVMLRMDKNKAVSRGWGMSNTKEGFFHPVPKLLAKVLTETDTMLVRFQPYGHNQVTITFDVRGFDEAYKKF